MNYLTKQIVFREVPDEVSLSYLITGCSLRCPGCHSADSWNPKSGQLLTQEILIQEIHKYSGWITCVLFMGGEWEPEVLIPYLRLIRALGLKTALYTGLEDVPSEIKVHLNYLKTGPYRAHLGGLDSPRTNQKLINLETGETLNPMFHSAKEAQYDSLK